MKWYVILFFIVVIEAIAVYFVKSASTTEDYGVELAASAALYALIPVGMYFIIRLGEGIAITNVLVDVTSVIWGLFVGMVLFGEVLSTTQKIGVGVGMLSIVLLMKEE